MFYTVSNVETIGEEHLGRKQSARHMGKLLDTYAMWVRIPNITVHSCNQINLPSLNVLLTMTIEWLLMKVKYYISLQGCFNHRVVTWLRNCRQAGDSTWSPEVYFEVQRLIA